VVALSGLRNARSPRGAPAGAALGILAAAALGFLIDWTWQIPAVTAPVLIVAAALTGGGAGRRLRVPAPALAVGVAVVAIPALWSGGVLAVATDRIDDSEAALAAGRPGDAARDARAAIAVQPWAAEPYLQLAEVERSVDNIEAANGAARAAIRRGPDDFRVWMLTASLAFIEGDVEAGSNYLARAFSLAPRLITRFGEFSGLEG
jgi:cytochrome c-type biogenesis protein CcmH/NrfG